MPADTPDPAARLADEARMIARLNVVESWSRDATERAIVTAAKDYAAAESQRAREAEAACAAMREKLSALLKAADRLPGVPSWLSGDLDAAEATLAPDAGRALLAEHRALEAKLAMAVEFHSDGYSVVKAPCEDAEPEPGMPWIVVNGDGDWLYEENGKMGWTVEGAGDGYATADDALAALDRARATKGTP